MDGFNIPYAILGDSDVEVGEKILKNIFSSPTYITKDGLSGDNTKIFVIKNGNLENLMKEINGNLYSAVEADLKKKYGRETPKPVLSYEFTKRLVATNPDSLKVIKDLLHKFLSVD